MSEPVGIIAKVKISEEAYKKFIRTEAKSIAVEIFDAFWHKYQSIYFFNYNKKEQSLYSFVLFNHGNQDTVHGSALYKSLLNVEPFLDAESSGYLFASLDSLNFTDFITEYAIENKKWKAHNFSTKETTAIWKEAGKKFFDKIEDVSDSDYWGHWLGKKIDKSIFKHFSTLKEEARVHTVKQLLPQATPLKPIQIFKSYFYNGCEFYFCDGYRDITIIDNIDLQNLEETSYGLTDGKCVIIGNKRLEENPKTFKVLHRMYTTFYKSDRAVYNKDLVLIPEADAESFKLTTVKRDPAYLYYGEDDNYIYYYYSDTPISKRDLGEFTCSDGLWYNEILLMGSKRIYLGAKHLADIDAPTFEKLTLKPNNAREFVKANYKKRETKAGSMEELILYGKDKHGELFIVMASYGNAKNDLVKTSFGLKNQEPIVLRKTEQEFWTWYLAYGKELAENAIPHFHLLLPDYNISLDYYLKFNQLMESPHFQLLYNEEKYEGGFLRAVNNYLYSCWQLYEKSGGLVKRRDKSYLEKGLTFYNAIEKDMLAEMNPYIFHHLCCFSVALNKLDDAILYFQKAYYYGYLEFQLMLTDKDLQPIFNHEKFQAIKNWYVKNVIHPVREKNWQWRPNPNPFPTINIFIIKMLQALPEKVKIAHKFKSDYLNFIMENFYICDLAQETNADSREYNDMILQFAPYFNRYIQNTIDLSWQTESAYHFYKDYQLTNAKTHLVRLEYLFYRAHNEHGNNEMTEEVIGELIEKIKAKLPAATAQEQDEIKQSKVLQMLKLEV